jgi:hypothetical protein
LLPAVLYFPAGRAEECKRFNSGLEVTSSDLRVGVLNAFRDFNQTFLAAASGMLPAGIGSFFPF